LHSFCLLAATFNVALAARNVANDTLAAIFGPDGGFVMSVAQTTPVSI